MTNTPPDPESSPKTALGFDEFIAVLVAFSTIGAVLFWSLSRKDTSWDFNGLLSLSPKTSATTQQKPVSPSPVPTVQPEADTDVDNLRSPLPAPIVVPSSAPSIIDKAPATSVLLPAEIAPTISPQAQGPVPSSITVNPEPFSLVTPSKPKLTIPPPIAFNDVPADFWGLRFINVLSSRGIIKGFPDYTFRPNQPVNRAEFAAILQGAFEYKPVKNTLKFKDVTDKSWANAAINQTISAGFLKGYPNQTFQPEQKIPRVQVLVALVSGLNLKTPASPEKILTVYKDAKDIPKYATDKIAAATVNGLVVNYPDADVFAPNKEATRAEVAAMVYQALVKMGRLEKIPSKNIVRVPQ
ncbi:S-layer domain-containing protein [Tolypothrix tenuis PCC 7101]|uniref:S-layer domain-containing protein n=1 Tax=Tolypothrix tenuis PCC 7101 TaxID=231146 RepID=A0A1Z4N687_9CYAN|nr:S-layer homology domain-containing protein [Aulosira sp. FACHB-113]BAZ01240.1 S-layer domain-containing protein [Tolypothrix tenuis PCC 7101]BAZ74838.1 S-layer domain-containing protein [Aulosira laxa NIES-50]